MVIRAIKNYDQSTMASSSFIPSNPFFGLQVSEKLTRQNYGVWSTQVLTTIKGVRLFGFIIGARAPPPEEVDEKQGDKTVKVPNPAYEDWVALNQQALGFLLATLSKDVLSQVAMAKTVAQVWKVIEDLFSSHTCARTINVRLALTTTKKETMTVSQYYAKMKALGDEIAAAGKTLNDEEMMGYILNGLDPDFNSLVSALITRVEPISLFELYSQLLSFETRLEIQQGGSGSSSSINVAGRGGRGGSGHGNRASTVAMATIVVVAMVAALLDEVAVASSSNTQTRINSNAETTPTSQLPMPMVIQSAKFASRLDIWRLIASTGLMKNYVPDERHIAATMNTYNVDTN